MYIDWRIPLAKKESTKKKAAPSQIHTTGISRSLSTTVQTTIHVIKQTLAQYDHLFGKLIHFWQGWVLFKRDLGQVKFW